MKFLLSIPLIFIRLVLQSISLALSQIWANKVRAVLTTLGIIIGVASVTSVIAALSGLKTKIMTDIETFGTNRIFVWPEWPDSGPKQHASWRVIRFIPDQFEGLLEHCPSVESLSMNDTYGDSIKYREQSIENARVHGIEYAWHKIESRPVFIGRPFSALDQLQGRLVCLVDPSLRDKLGLDKDPTGAFITIGHFPFRVIGVVERRPSMSMIDVGGRGEEYEVFVPFNTLYYKLQYMPWFTAMAASKSPEVSDEAKAEIRFFLRQKRHLKPGEPDTFEVFTVESEVRKITEMSTRITLVAGGVVCISLLVGGVGIMNIMLVSVSERTREIGLRKAVGAKGSAILTQFLIEAIVLCCVGGFVGIAAGQGLTMLIAKIPNVNLDKAYIPVWAIIMSFGFSAAVGVFFGMFPAAKAARLDPIEALRHE